MNDDICVISRGISNSIKEMTSLNDKSIISLQTKVCRRCKIEKPVSEFGIHNRTQDGLQSWCKQCKHEDSKERYRKSKNNTVTPINDKSHINLRHVSIIMTELISEMTNLNPEDVVEMALKNYMKELLNK